MQLYMIDDSLDNLPLMADKIWVRSTDKGFLEEAPTAGKLPCALQVCVCSKSSFMTNWPSSACHL